MVLHASMNFLFCIFGVIFSSEVSFYNVHYNIYMGVWIHQQSSISSPSSERKEKRRIVILFINFSLLFKFIFSYILCCAVLSSLFVCFFNLFVSSHALPPSPPLSLRHFLTFLTFISAHFLQSHHLHFVFSSFSPFPIKFLFLLFSSSLSCSISSSSSSTTILILCLNLFMALFPLSLPFFRLFHTPLTCSPTYISLSTKNVCTALNIPCGRKVYSAFKLWWVYYIGKKGTCWLYVL